MNSTRKWYAVYTKPRWEKKVYRILQEKGVESYCPLNKVRRKWSDRYKIVEEPLFKSYVFVKCSESEKTPVRMVNGVVNFVYWLGKPATIGEKEIETIRKFLDEYEDVEARPLNLEPNSVVYIENGAFMDKEATVVRVLRKQVEVIIESIGYSLTAYIDKSRVSVVKKTKG